MPFHSLDVIQARPKPARRLAQVIITVTMAGLEARIMPNVLPTQTRTNTITSVTVTLGRAVLLEASVLMPSSRAPVPETHS